MSRLEDALTAGRFVVTSELLSVDSGGLDAVHERFAPYADHVDATNATDNTSAHAHASPLAVAIALKQLGMEPIMQLVCRDRNRLGLEAEIAGAALQGIENVLCLTGDDVTAGDEPEARRVFDLDSVQLLALGSAMARGTYLSGRRIDPPPRLFLGAVENSGAPPFDYRVDRALKKVRAGARFLQLQVSFHPERLEEFMAEAVEKGLADQCSLLPSICLTRSPAALRYIDEQVPGIEVPAALIERCERAADPEAECFEVAVELAQHARSLPGVAGLHLISFRREAGIARLCERLGIPPRAERENSGHGRPVAV
ncbi:MAG TPA: methylenetetrahydrofolate reductase [Gaiellaceae bacterium]|nr:methylenetetrahydrofolate reductase [Gaiellaceae bacterium]